MQSNFKPIYTITPRENKWENGTWKFMIPAITPIKGTTPSYIDIIISGTTSVTLTNAIGLNYVKLFGDTEQRNLPSGYTQLEFLQSDGACYIDLLRVPNNDDIIEQKFQKVGTSATTCSWYGSMPSSQQITPRIGIGTYNSQVATFFAGVNYTGAVADADTNIHTLRFQATGRQELTYTLDGVTNVIDASTGITPPDMYEPAIELTSYLFARHGTNGVQVYDNEGTKIYYHREYLANGTLALNVVPAKRNSDNVLGMYDTVSGQFFTNLGTGTFTAGSTAVPTPDAPMDIVCNNGVIKFNANLLDANTITTGYYIKDNGVITEQSNAFYSALIPVKPNTSYVFSRVGTTGQYIRIHGYDANGDWQEMLAKTDTTSDLYLVATTESNTAYVRISARVGTDMEFKLGDTYPTNIITYTDGTTETVQVTGKNLFDKTQTPYSSGYYVANTTVVGSNIVTLQNSNYNIYKIEVKPNTTYTFGKIKATNPSWAVVDNNDIVLQTGINDGGTDGRDITITTGATAKYLYLSVAVAGTYKCDDILQLEQGSTATTYEQYFNGGSATAEMLLKVGTYQDVQSVLDGEVTRQLGIKVLTGDNAKDGLWGTSAGASNLYSLTIANSSTDNTFLPISTHFVGVLGSVGYSAIQNGQFKHGSNSNTYFFKDTSSEDVTAFKAFLADQYNAGNPVIVVYPLATATTETVTGQQLTVHNGTNIVEITQASIDNLSLEVSYKQTT